MSTDILTRVTRLVAEALDRDPERVRPSHSLIDDLGAESIDFLDLQFRIESEFSLRIPEDEIWKGVVDVEDPGWVRDGRLTDDGLARLRELDPDFAWERFPAGVSQRELPRLITVTTIVRYLEPRVGETD